jgi:glycerol-3-phosphate acyltransferase PlsX
MGRLPGVIRPAIATPIPDLKKDHPTVMLDAGANAEATSAMLLQFAQMGAAYSSKRYGVVRPRVALLSIGEEKSKGTPLVKETHAILAEGGHGDFEFVGNVEGRDFFEDQADVIVTDGFTGNVALKTLEGTLRFLLETLTGIFSLPEVADAAGVLLPHLLPLAATLDPESTGGAMLLHHRGPRRGRRRPGRGGGRLGALRRPHHRAGRRLRFSPWRTPPRRGRCPG